MNKNDKLILQTVFCIYLDLLSVLGSIKLNRIKISHSQNNIVNVKHSSICSLQLIHYYNLFSVDINHTSNTLQMSLIFQTFK